MTVIRPAEITDIPEVVRMGERFFETAGWPDYAEWDEASITATLESLITGDLGEVFVLEEGGKLVGMAGGMLFPFYFNHNHLTGQELFWWIEPEHRGQGAALFDALEGWAKAAGAMSFTMIAVDRLKADVMGRIYRMRGYRAAEHSYIKRFN